MKKFWLLSTLLVAGLLLTGCKNINCKYYFDWCNTCVDWGICTQQICVEYKEPYCSNDYDEFLETIASSWETINDYPEEEPKEENILVTEKEEMNTNNVINLKIWDSKFDVVLEDSSSTVAFVEKLKQWDIVVNASEYWGFEKVWDLGFDLPREDKQITTQLWDIVLYNWNQISLFYDSNSWSYTKLWKVQNITESDLWDWDIILIFSLKK